jgi:predicted PurR-regulated permease PerM
MAGSSCLARKSSDDGRGAIDWRPAAVARAHTIAIVRARSPGSPNESPISELPPDEPASYRDRWRAGIYLTTTGSLTTLVLLAVVFDQFAAMGVLLVVFLSFVLAYLIAPAMERLRTRAAPSRRGKPLSRSVAVLMIYGVIGAITLPIWTLAGTRMGAALERMTVLVPQHTTRFIDQLHATERWHTALHLPQTLDAMLGSLTSHVTRSVEGEARKLGSELTHVSQFVPWLSTVPVVAFLLLTRWTRFRRSTTRVLPTPHLQWRGNELLRNLNSLLAAYTRAQALSALVVGGLCWIGFAALHVPYPGTLAIAAMLLEMIPLAGPLIVAVVATAMAPDRVASVLIFLAMMRVVQDYLIYPRLISRALHLHPLLVVLALWAGAALGGVVGVCLAIPVVGALQVTWRHYREYHDIERLIAIAATTPSPGSDAPASADSGSTPAATPIAAPPRTDDVTPPTAG